MSLPCQITIKVSTADEYSSRTSTGPHPTMGSAKLMSSELELCGSEEQILKSSPGLPLPYKNLIPTEVKI